jgi:hypothetical protein
MTGITTVRELRARGVDLKIKGAYKMRKEELEKAVIAEELKIATQKVLSQCNESATPDARTKLLDDMLAFQSEHGVPPGSDSMDDVYTLYGNGLITRKKGPGCIGKTEFICNKALRLDTCWKHVAFSWGLFGDIAVVREMCVAEAFKISVTGDAVYTCLLRFRSRMIGFFASPRIVDPVPDTSGKSTTVCLTREKYDHIMAMYRQMENGK